MIWDYVAQRQAEGDTRDSQEIAIEYDNTAIYPDKVRAELLLLQALLLLERYRDDPGHRAGEEGEVC